MSLLSFFGLQNLTPSPADDFWYTSTGRQTVAGVAVDEGTALTYSACWAATMLLGSTGGMAPLLLLRKDDKGGSREALDDPRYWMANVAPNDDMTSMMYRSAQIAQQVNRGNCYSEIERTQGGLGIKLHPIHASRIPPRTNIKRENGQLVYYINNDDGSKTQIRAENMLHIPSPISEDGIVGRGVVENARLSIGFGIAVETQGAAYFGNAARPAVVIAGGKFKDKQDREEYRRQWNEVHGGPVNNAKPTLLPEGATISTLSFSAEDSQFLSTRQHNVEEIARWYGVPPHLIGHLLRATFNNIEQMSLEFVKYSLMKWLVLREQEMNRKLLTPEERKTMYFRHDTDELERADLAVRTAAWKDRVFNGEGTINEWRAAEHQNPIGPLGDLHFVQSAMVPLEIAAKGPKPPAAVPPPKLEADDGSSQLIAGLQAELLGTNEALALAQTEVAMARADALASKAVQQQLASAMLRDVWSRMLSVEVNAVKRVAEKASKFDTRLREFYDGHAGRLERELTSPIAVYLLASGDGRQAAEVVRVFAAGHVAESLRQIAALTECTADELAGRVESCVGKWHEERAEVAL